jgi:hypothetical protein
MRNCRLPPPRRRDMLSSRILRSVVGNSLPTFRDNLSCLIVKRNEIKEEDFLLRLRYPFEMGPTGCAETSGMNNHWTMRNIAAEPRYQNYVFRKCCCLDTEHHFRNGDSNSQCPPSAYRPRPMFRKIHVMSPGRLADVTLTTLQSSRPIRVTIPYLVTVL